MYKELIDSLVGKNKRFQLIRRLDPHGNGANTHGMSYLQGKRYCSSIDEQLLEINK